MSKTIVVIGSKTMGQGDDKLGAMLMKSFIYSLTQLDTLPNEILLYNTGATLAAPGSPVLPDLLSLQESGVQILTCGTCAGYFDLTDKIQVGSITNMYAIVEKMQQADHIIRP